MYQSEWKKEKDREFRDEVLFGALLALNFYLYPYLLIPNLLEYIIK